MNQSIQFQIKQKIINIASNIFQLNDINEDLLNRIIVNQPPENVSNFDLSTNISMIYASIFKKNPYLIAQELLSHIQSQDFVKNIEIKKPGFINFDLSNLYLNKIIFSAKDDSYGFKTKENVKSDPVNIEYVSANPTGPLHVGHIRCAVYGEAICKLLEKSGQKVTREYYVNDGGSQIDKLLNSFLIRYKEFQNKTQPEEHQNIEYSGNYLLDLAAKTIEQDEEINNLIQKNTISVDEKFLLKQYIVEKILNMIKSDLKKIDIQHDVFTYESNIIKSGKLDKVFEQLSKDGMIYEGFIDENGYNKKIIKNDNDAKKHHLIRTTKFGDDQDRVFKKANGEWAYISADIAYHKDKFDRNFKNMILILGSDHKGQARKIEIGTKCVTNNKANLHIKMFEQVNYINDGKKIKMSKRSGNFLTLDDILKTGIDKNILKFILLSKKPTTVIDFDVAKLKKQSKENPVFYVQYAHCRLHSIINKSNIDCKSFDNIKIEDIKDYNLENKYLRLMILKIDSLSELINKAIENKEPNLIISYLIEIASIFHSSWNGDQIENKIKYIDENKNITYYNIYICFILKKIIKNCLNVLGIEEIYYL